MENQTTTVVAAIPGNGWFALHEDGQRQEVLTWLITNDGDVMGMVPSGPIVVPADSYEGFAEYLKDTGQ